MAGRFDPDDALDHEQTARALLETACAELRELHDFQSCERELAAAARALSALRAVQRALKLLGGAS